MLPLLHSLIPLGWGPPRSGAELARCLTTSATTVHPRNWIAGRYQEASLLELPLHTLHSDDQSPLLSPLIYQRAWNRRYSQYDLEAGESDHYVSYETAIACGDIYLGPSHWLGTRCIGERSPVKVIREQCGLDVTQCVCPLETDDQGQLRNAKRGSRTLTP